MSNLDGSDAEAFAEFEGAPELPLGMAYDSLQQKIFFVNDKYDFSGGVWTINIDGSGLTEIIEGVDAGAITLDLLNGKLYYADWIGGVFMANIDGSEVININPELDNIFVWGIAVDPEAGFLYVSDKTNSLIIRSGLDGSNPVGWLSEINPYAIVIDIPR
jgi:DNA-binding beta-propeller fold protein YncE